MPVRAGSWRRCVFAMLVCCAVDLTGVNAIAQDPRAQLPLPEMQRLAKFYVGTWSYTERYPKSASAPNGLTNTGVYTSELGPGGNSIINRFHSKGPAGESEGLMLMTWDPREMAYKSFVFGGDFPGTLVLTGQFEGDALVYRGEITAGAMKIVIRNSTTIGADGKMISEEYSSASGAAEKLLVHVDAVRK